MEFLALDLATKTGWATNIHGNRSGTVEFPVSEYKKFIGLGTRDLVVWILKFTNEFRYPPRGFNKPYVS